ncbi:MAG: hypothetical protein MUC30_03770 [Bacteroidales bacterium]|nr:hypothetical protein [Bacteroidales bacterium]
MALLAASCIYPVWFALNTSLKDNRGYVLDRFGWATDPSLANFVTAWDRARFSEYFVNSLIVTAGAVALLLVVSSLAGFALETDDELPNAISKLKRKNLDIIILNSLKDEGAGFGHDTNRVTIIDHNNNIDKFELKTKGEVASDILQKIVSLVQ